MFSPSRNHRRLPQRVLPSDTDLTTSGSTCLQILAGRWEVPICSRISAKLLAPPSARRAIARTLHLPSFTLFILLRLPPEDDRNPFANPSQRDPDIVSGSLQPFFLSCQFAVGANAGSRPISSCVRNAIRQFLSVIYYDKYGTVTAAISEAEKTSFQAQPVYEVG
jgi:hypothetical protein